MESTSSEQWLKDQIQPATRRHVGCKGTYSFIYLRGNLTTKEQGCIGIAVKQRKPSELLHFEFWPLPVLEQTYNGDTNIDWGDTIAEAVACMEIYKSTDSLPSFLEFDPVWRVWRDVDIPTLIRRTTSQTAGFHDMMCKQGKLGGEEPNPTPAISPVLRRISAERLVNYIILEETERRQIARISGVGLVATLNTGDQQEALEAARQLVSMQKDDENMTVIVTCETFARNAVAKLLTSMENLGVQAVVGKDESDVMDKFDELQKYR